MKNYGVLEGKQPSDYVAGTLPYEIRLESGDWDAFLPPGEWQWKDGADTMACVTFSLLNAIETQEYYLTGKRVNYSDRWIAKMSGTTTSGNYLYKVADTIRQYGLVLEEDYPAPDSFAWDVYYADIPEPLNTELKIKGGEWLKTHTFQYEWSINNADEMLKQLKQCPLQVTIPGHAIEGYAITKPEDIVKYFDTYEPFKKTTTPPQLRDVLKPLLTIKIIETMRLINDNGTYYVVGNKGKIGIADPDALAIFKKVTDQEETGSTNVPEVAVFEKSNASLTVK